MGEFLEAASRRLDLSSPAQTVQHSLVDQPTRIRNAASSKAAKQKLTGVRSHSAVIVDLLSGGRRLHGADQSAAALGCG
jgi:hypothetical protein